MNAITDISKISQDAISYFYLLLGYATVADASTYSDGSSFIDMQIDDDNIQIEFDANGCVESAIYFVEGGNYDYPLELTEEHALAKEALYLIQQNKQELVA